MGTQVSEERMHNRTERANLKAPRMPLSVRKLIAVPIAAALAACCMAGCGSSSHQSSTAAAAATTGSSSCNLGAAKQEIAQYVGVPGFTNPGPAFDASKLRGKLIYDVPALSDAPFINLTDQAMAQVASRLGIRFQIYRNNGQPSQYVQGMDQAIAAHANAIILDGTNPNILEPQIAAAKQAGIPVISAHHYTVSEQGRAPGLAASIITPYNLVGRLLAEYVMIKSNCNANILATYFSDVPHDPVMASVVKSEVAKICGSRCSVHDISLPETEFASKMQSSVQTYLLSHQGTNWIVPLEDYSIEFTVPALVATNTEGKIKIATANGTPAVLKLIHDGTVTMNVGEDINWNASADIDQTMRVMLGLKPVANEYTGYRIFDPTNVDDTGNPPEYNRGYGNAYVAGYAKLWGQQ